MYDLLLNMLNHKRNKVCNSRPRSYVQALLMGLDVEKFYCPEKLTQYPHPVQGILPW